MSKEKEQGMSVIVKTVTRLTVGLVMLYGIYIVTHGHLTPGGGFAGGVIIALSLINLMLAYGKEVAFKKLSKAGAATMESSGAVLFLAIALLGFLGGMFFVNFLPKGEVFDLFSAGTIPLSNIAISMKVGAGMFSIFLAVVLLKYESEKK